MMSEARALPLVNNALAHGETSHESSRCGTPRLPRHSRKVLGADLNRLNLGRDATELAPVPPPQTKAHPV